MGDGRARMTVVVCEGTMSERLGRHRRPGRESNGGPRWNRTSDPLVKSQVLYP